MPNMTSLDDTDRLILYALKRNGRMAYTTLARELEISEGTVRSRVQRLQEERVIEHFTVKTRGLQVKAMVHIVVDRNVNTTEISESIATYDGVERVFETAGENDITVLLDMASTLELNDIIESIRQTKEVNATHTQLILKEVPISA